MGLQIGRVGLNDVDLIAPYAGSETVDEWQMSGWFYADTEAEFQTLAQQLRGYPCPDEPIVPVILSGDLDTSRNGFYEVLAVTVNRAIDAGEFAMAGKFDVTLRRITGKSAPAIECLYAGALLSNSVSVTDSLQWYTWAVPATAFDRNGPTAGTWTTRLTATGELAYWYDDVAAFTNNLYWADAPGNYYTGACVIEAKSAGDTGWHTVVGWDVENLPTAFRVTNGLVRVTFNGSRSFYVEWFNGTDWSESDNEYTLAGDSFGDLDVVTSVSVIRNAPEQCRVKVTYSTDLVSSSGRVQCDFMLRRGSRIVSGVVKSDVVQKWSVRSEGSGAYNSITGGVCRSSNDGDGNRDLLLTPHTVGKSLAAGSGGKCELSSSDDVFVFGVALEINGTVSSPPDRFGDVRYEFFAVATEHHRVRGR